MEQITYYFNLILTTSKNFLTTIPKDITTLGITCGFFVFSFFQTSYPSRKPSIIQEICSASKKLALLTYLILFFYIFSTLTTKILFFYLITTIIGVIIYHILLLILSYLNVVGIFINNLLMLLSGPIVIFVAWFFYTGELIEKLNKLINF